MSARRGPGPYGRRTGLSISPLIKQGTSFDPDQVAEAWYNLYDKRTEVEDTFPKGIMQFINK